MSRSSDASRSDSPNPSVRSFAAWTVASCASSCARALRSRADRARLTSARTSAEAGLVVAHAIDDDRVWDSPAEAVAAAPTGWVAIRGTLHVDSDGFVQLCAQVVDERCEGGVVVRGSTG